jgi:hypothetical protein
MIRVQVRVKSGGAVLCFIRVNSRSFAVPNAFCTSETHTGKLTHPARHEGVFSVQFSVFSKSGSTPEGRVPKAPEADECMQYCQDGVYWNNHPVPSASDRSAAQAAPVLPDVFSTGALTHWVVLRFHGHLDSRGRSSGRWSRQAAKCRSASGTYRGAWRIVSLWHHQAGND